METMHYFLSTASCEFLFIADHYHLHNAGQNTVVVMCVRVNRSGAEDFPLVAPRFQYLDA